MAAYTDPEAIGKEPTYRLLVRTDRRPFVLIAATTFEETAEAEPLAEILEGVIEAYLMPRAAA